MPDKQDVEVIIRQAEVGDARAILGMLSQIRQESPYVVLADNSDDVDAQVTIIEQYNQHPHALMLVSEVDGQLVGFATVQPQGLPAQAHVAEIGVCLIAEYWGYGIGSLLMETMLDFAQGVGLRVLHLEVIADNLPAIGLYKKFDFQERGRLTQRVARGGRYYDTILMEYVLKDSGQ
ncbi:MULTISPECIES: GNAT family N-acetyltransferase [Abiotrophia]|jgi:hypothetical protein|uniref:GNAT family N-acetyltransferase n=1 Tax=Abiotrophia TaxID=46123 RepID=UPI0027BA3362|nr:MULTISPECIES: GNAT family N-acetyltransferase [Abiotrophia]